MSCDACKSIFLSEVKLAPADVKDDDYQYTRRHHRDISELCHAARNHCRICGDVWRYFFHPTTPEQYDEGTPGFWNGTSIDASTSGHAYIGSGTTWRLRRGANLVKRGAHPEAVLLDFFINSPMNHDRTTFSFLIQPAAREDLMQLMSWQVREQQSTSGGIAMVDGLFREQQRWDMVDQWMLQCLRKHKHCNTEGRPRKTMHSRAIYIPNSTTRETTHYKLVDTRSPSVHFHQPYITLSHVWGEKQPPWRTTRANFAARRSSGIAVQELPRTFRDAIDVARRVGATLLWIDSLCIIQDDEEDKAREIANMTDIYMNSTLNLSATSASNSHEGLTSSIELHPRLTGTAWTGDLRGGNYRIMDLKFWRHRMSDAKINTRGWVLQERCLAPRTLHFAFNQLLWECCELSASEEFPDGIPAFLGTDPAFKQSMKTLRTTALPGQFSDHRKAMYSLWASTVMHYAQCDLTYPSDKLIAIAGLAKAIADQLSGDLYLAGLWKENLLPQLLWYSDGMKSRIDAPRAAGMYSSDYGTSSRPHEYRAPSWSWASVDGIIRLAGYIDCSGAPNFDDDGNVSSMLVPVAAVRSCSVTTKVEGDPFSEVIAARLVIQGRLYRIRIAAGRYGHGLEALFHTTDDRVPIRYDEPQDPADLQQVYYLPLLYKHISWTTKPEVIRAQEQVFLDSAAIYGIKPDGSQEREDEPSDAASTYKEYLKAELKAMGEPGYHDTVSGLVIVPTKDEQAFCRIGMIETQKRKLLKLDEHAKMPALQAEVRTREVLEICRPSKAAASGDVFDGTIKLV